MRLRYVCLCILIFAVGAAAAQGGFSIQQSMQQSIGMTSGNDDDFLNFTLPGFGMGMSFPDFGFEFNMTSSSDFDQAYSFFDKYYVSTPLPVVGIVSTPIKVDITHKMPSDIYFSGHKVKYSQYTSAVASNRGNELWIQGISDWSQYVICPVGTGLQLIAFTPAGGQAELYEIFQTTYPATILNVTNKQYPLYPLYNSMYFAADKIGRHILLFVLNGQPSNAIIIDVTQVPQQAPMQQTQGSSYQGANTYTQTYGQQYNQQQYGQQQYTSQQYTSTSIPSPTPVPVPRPGDTPVTIQSQGMKGYQVFLDESYIGTEGTNGDPLDGNFNFKVVGGQSHDVRVYDGQFNYPNRIYFPKGALKIIRVEPGTAVYV